MTGPCPSADRLLAFMAGGLAEGAAAEVEAHIDACAACREALSSLARGAAPSPAFGRYRLETVLGSGGMGIVYRGWHPELARPVAIKVLRHAEGDAAARARLVREAQSLARLSHANVCHVYDVGSDGDEVWVAMELVDGVNLRRWAAEHPSPDEILPVLLGAAEGLAAAHAADIIHRDVKPENVLVTRDGRAVVTDFGLARVEVPLDPAATTLPLEPKLTASGAVAGTPAYLAPEQLAGGPIDARVDQFAWALMTWELLTGVRPFPLAPGARLEAIRAGVAAPPGISRQVAAVLTRAMAAAPRDRFPSMRHLIDALRARSGPRRARRPLGPWAVAAIAAGLAVGSTVLVWRLIRTPPPSAAPADPHAQTPTTPDAQTPMTTDAQARIVQPLAPPAPAPEVRSPDSGPTGAQALAIAGRRPIAAPRPPPPGPVDLSSLPDRLRYLPDRAHAVVEMFCGIPMDPAKPGADVRWPVLDWGKVTRRELVTAKLAGREHTLLMYEVQGARAIYRFNGSSWSNTIGVLDAPPGRWVALCEQDRSELYEMPPAWRFPTSRLEGVLPLTAPPRVAEIAHLDPIHTSVLSLQTGGRKGTLRADRRHLVRAKVEAADGPRWKMGGWWLEVPPGVKGSRLVAAGRSLWFVVERPTLEEQGDGAPARLVVHAAAILDDLLPH